jgi:hypothetical protein
LGSNIELSFELPEFVNVLARILEVILGVGEELANTE